MPLVLYQLFAIRPIGMASAVLLGLFAMIEMAQYSEAAKPTYKQLMAACKAKYGKNVVKAVMNKDGSVVCHLPPRQMTRAEAFEACRTKYGATTILLVKKKTGWLCRYYGRY